MIKKIIILLLSFVSFVSLAQQDPTAVKYGSTITAADLKANLSIVASDAMEGRETGKRGQKMAAAFIAFTFQDLGLAPQPDGTYYQPVPLYSTGISGVTLKANGAEMDKSEFVYLGSSETADLIELPIVWVGNGTEAEIAKLDIKDKAVVVAMDAVGNMMSNPTVLALREKGAKMIFVVLQKDEDFARIANRFRNAGEGRLSLEKPGTQNNNPGTFYLTWNAAAKIFKSTPESLKKSIADKKIAKIKPATVIYSVSSSVKEVRSENVLAFLEGTDKKDEIVVVTAHYDHIGVSTRAEGDKINNGADDDGSGTVAVLALAKAFAQAKKEGNGPRRSILFMTVTGEEKGLLGSSYYTDHPLYPMEQTVVNLNIDMIGRTDPQHKGSAPYVYVIGADKLSSELHTLSESVNKKYNNLIFDYTYNDQNHPDRLYYRSDHWNFAKKNIPIVFYFDGIHEDYHKVSDEVNKIEFDLLTLRAQTVFYTAWEIANRDSRFTIDKK